MAKVQIKSEKITPFGGIFHVMEHFSRFVGPVIDNVIVNSFIYFSHLPTCNKAVPSPGRWRMHRHNGLAHR